MSPPVDRDRLLADAAAHSPDEDAARTRVRAAVAAHVAAGKPLPEPFRALPGTTVALRAGLALLGVAGVVTVVSLSQPAPAPPPPEPPPQPAPAVAITPVDTAPEAPTPAPEPVAAPPRPARRTTTAPDEDTLAIEVRLIAAARNALQDGRLDDAERTLAEHGTRFPDGTLAPERQLLRIRRACAAHAPTADALRAAFKARFPSHPDAESISRGCPEP